jgi:RNA polymerase sigma factor (sigma-70 family)
MERQLIDTTSSLEAMLPAERARIVRLCARITGNMDVAEDLAQETMLEAWRHIHELRDPERRSQWLSGIARNVCLRWGRKRGRDLANLVEPHSDQDNALEDTLTDIADDFDIEVELERKELIELLDRALGLLPAETRAVLVKRYVEESPLAEVAEQLGSNANAVAMRLQRGKLALRRLLLNELRQESELYSSTGSDAIWEETPLWCHICGRNRLQGRRTPEEGKLLLRCPECSPGKDTLLSRNHLPALQGLKSYRPMFSRLLVWCDRYYRTALREGFVACERCGHMQAVSISLARDLPDEVCRDTVRPWCVWRDEDRVLSTLCAFCDGTCTISLDTLALTTPQGRSFLQAHPKIRTLPEMVIEAQGRTAVVTRFASVTDNAQLAIISDCATYAVLDIQGGEL